MTWSTCQRAVKSCLACSECSRNGACNTPSSVLVGVWPDMLLPRLVCRLRDADENGLTRIHRSVIERDIRRLDMLIKCGADFEEGAGELGVLPLRLAVLSGDDDPACLERLLAAGANANTPDSKGTTALRARFAHRPGGG